MNFEDFTEFERGLEGASAEASEEAGVADETLEEEAAAVEEPQAAVEEPEPELGAEESEAELEPEVLPENAVEEVDEVTALRMQLEALQARFVESQEELRRAQAAGQGEPEPEFLTDDEFEDALSSREALNKVLARVAAEAVSRAQPVQSSSGDQELVKKFYADNPELERFRPEVGRLATEIGTAEPGLSTEEILARTAEAARARFGLPKAGAKVRRVEVKKPAGTTKPGRARQKAAPTLTVLEQDLEAMLKVSGF